MVELPVDQRSESVARVRLHPLPHVQDGPTGGVHQHAADGAQSIQVLDSDAEGRENHDVGRRHHPEIELSVVRMMEAFHPHVVELCVDVRIVDDLADQEDALRRELGTRLVRVFHGSVDSIAKAELAGQLEREVPRGERVPAPANQVYEPAVIVSGESALDGAFEAETAAEIGLLHAWQSNRRPRSAGA
jgi:hypothetical protein